MIRTSAIRSWVFTVQCAYPRLWGSQGRLIIHIVFTAYLLLCVLLKEIMHEIVVV